MGAITKPEALNIRAAARDDCGLILEFITELAEYEKLAHEVTATREELFVRPDYRGNGIGKALLSRLARIVVDRKGGRLDWWVLKWNRPAIEFYEGIGAIGMDEWMPMRLEGEALRKIANED